MELQNIGSFFTIEFQKFNYVKRTEIDCLKIGPDNYFCLSPLMLVGSSSGAEWVQSLRICMCSLGSYEIVSHIQPEWINGS